MASSYLLVLGDRVALGWVLTQQQMAFSAMHRREVSALASGDRLFLLTTRSCFKNPTRDRTRIIGEATVKSEVRARAAPLLLAGREFSRECELEVGRLAPLHSGIELVPIVPRLEAFAGAGSGWAVRLRRSLVRLPNTDARYLAHQMRLVSPPSRATVREYSRWYAESVQYEDEASQRVLPNLTDQEAVS